MRSCSPAPKSVANAGVAATCAVSGISISAATAANDTE
jgi:hypothetical protein